MSAPRQPGYLKQTVGLSFTLSFLSRRGGEIAPLRVAPTCGSGANIGAESEREHPVDVDHSDPDERSDGGREDGRALHEHRETRAQQNRDQPARIWSGHVETSPVEPETTGVFVCLAIGSCSLEEQMLTPWRTLRSSQGTRS